MGILSESDHVAHDFAVAEKVESDRRVQQAAEDARAAEALEKEAALADARGELVSALIARARESYRSGKLAMGEITILFDRNPIAAYAPFVEIFDKYALDSGEGLMAEQLALINDLLHIKDDGFGVSHKYVCENIVDPSDGLVGRRRVGITFTIRHNSTDEEF